MSIYFFYGNEEYNIELEIQKLKKKLLDKNFASMNFKTANNPNFADFVALLRTQPMMFGNMIIVIKVEDYFSKSLEDSQLDEIENALKNNPESLCIVFIAEFERNENKKIDTRKKFYKILSKYAQIQEFPAIKPYKTDEISNWIIKEAKKREISFEKEATEALIEQVGNNLRELCLELDKLKLLAYPQTLITKKMVREICISNEDLFSFADFLLKGEKCKALLEFEKLLDKKHSLEILSALHTMLRKWITVKSKSRELPLFEIAKLTGQHEFVVKTTLEKMKNTPLADLVKLKQNLIEAEFKIKTGESVDVVEEIKNSILKI
ncbi:MAG TPA: DNA polymerase III subunit delta [Candidatus Gastranaerophilaceae bacterium]|nr:DNA polymerase III subunit delta [Candidatus Gastranaerophilaceae bacterium]HPT42134.1 DNA polymerase III subunit delta [Candidatus Gastranaerophilaceae bacterium]